MRIILRKLMAISNSMILLLAGCVMGGAMGLMMGANVDINDVKDIAGAVTGSAVTIITAVFLGGWKDRREAVRDAYAVQFACYDILQPVRNATHFTTELADLDLCADQLLDTLMDGRKGIIAAANGSGLHPACSWAGFACVKAIDLLIHEVGRRDFGENGCAAIRQRAGWAMDAVTKFRDQSNTEAKMLT